MSEHKRGELFYIISLHVVRLCNVVIEHQCVCAASQVPLLPASNVISPTSSSADGWSVRRWLPPTVPRGALLQPNHQNAVDRGN